MNEATQTGVAMAAIGMVGTVVGLLIGWLKDRDKLRYDAEFAKLKANWEKCNEEHTIAKKEIADLHARDKSDKMELQTQINTLKQQLDSAAAVHQPASGKFKKPSQE